MGYQSEPIGKFKIFFEISPFWDFTDAQIYNFSEFESQSFFENDLDLTRFCNKVMDIFLLYGFETVCFGSFQIIIMTYFSIRLTAI